MEQSKLEKMSKYAPVVVRVGISLVVLWFGTQQVLDTESWTRLIPEWATATSGMSAATLVYINGVFELIFGTLLLLGLFTRVVAGLIALHMIHITFTVGYNGVGVRDFGLTMAAISVFLGGVDACCLDRYLSKPKFN